MTPLDALMAVDPSIIPDTKAQAKLEALKSIPPAKLAARMPSWYKTHQRNCNGADCLSPLPTLRPEPVFVVKPPSLGAPDSHRPIVFARMVRVLHGESPDFTGPAKVRISANIPIAEYIAAFEKAAQLKR